MDDVNAKIDLLPGYTLRLHWNDSEVSLFASIHPKSLSKLVLSFFFFFSYSAMLVEEPRSCMIYCIATLKKSYFWQGVRRSARRWPKPPGCGTWSPCATEPHLQHCQTGIVFFFINTAASREKIIRGHIFESMIFEIPSLLLLLYVNARYLQVMAYLTRLHASFEPKSNSLCTVILQDRKKRGRRRSFKKFL